MHNTTIAPEIPALPGTTHRFVELPSVRMHIATAGEGSPVLLLHGFPQHWWEWHDVIPGLAPTHLVICPDLRGAGWTDAPRRGYTRDDLAEDLVALLDALELERVDIISHDMGSISGFALCQEHPKRVRRHVAIGVPPPFIHFTPRLIPVMKHLWFQQALATPGLGARLARGKKQKLPRYLFRSFAAGPDFWTEARVEAYIAQLREPARASAASALYRHLVMPEFSRILRGRYRRQRLTTPTLLLFGAEDAAFTPALAEHLLRGWEEYADSIEYDFIEGAAHFAVDEQPAQVLARAQEFLDA
jgi:pimeloyl-ACP methyl ester carboxylesterase